MLNAIFTKVNYTWKELMSVRYLIIVITTLNFQLYS